MLGLIHRRRWPTFGDWALVALFTGLLGLVALIGKGLWAVNRVTLELASRRAAAACPEHFLWLAELAWGAAWCLLLAGVWGLATSAHAPADLGTALLGLAAAGALAWSGVWLIRRGQRDGGGP